MEYNDSLAYVLKQRIPFKGKDLSDYTGVEGTFSSWVQRIFNVKKFYRKNLCFL